MTNLRGLIIRSQSGFYSVKTESETLVCHLRGRLKQGPRIGDVVAIGDWVSVADLGNGNGMIEAIEPRRRMLSRLDPTPRGVYQQIIVANLDLVVLVFACADPAPHLGMLDRFLVAAERQAIPILIIANKVDLVGMDEAKAIFSGYEALGYSVLYTSARESWELETMRACLQNKISVFVGPSGVGKSSLLNAIQPGLGAAVREISQTTHKGKHTTVVRELFPLLHGGYIADTPGLKALALWDIQPEELDGYFPELRQRVSQCAFSDCTHLHEPGCAVLAAVASGEVQARRYESYVRMRQGQEA